MIISSVYRKYMLVAIMVSIVPYENKLLKNLNFGTKRYRLVPK